MHTRCCLPHIRICTCIYSCMSMFVHLGQRYTVIHKTYVRICIVVCIHTHVHVQCLMASQHPWPNHNDVHGLIKAFWLHSIHAPSRMTCMVYYCWIEGFDRSLIRESGYGQGDALSLNSPIPISPMHSQGTRFFLQLLVAWPCEDERTSV